MGNKIDMKIGFDCNNHCKFCVQGNKREFFGKTKKNEVFEKLQNGIDNGYDELVFTGGEPTIYKELPEYIKFARDIGYKIIQIQTNGKNFFDIDYCIKLITAGATEFSPSLHGFYPKTHDELVCSEGSWEKTVKGIQNLKKLKQRILINSVVTKQNYKEIPKLAYLLCGLGVDQYQFAFIHILGSANINKQEIVPTKTEIQKYIFKGLDIGKKYGITCMTEAIPFCFMQGYEQHIAEYNFMTDAKIFDATSTINSYKSYRQNEGKIKGQVCEKCSKNNMCEGPWKEYIELYGWKEFKSL